MPITSSSSLHPVPVAEASTDERVRFLQGRAPRPLIAANACFAVIYFFIITFWFPRSNPWLFGLLIFGEVFHVWQLVTYCLTVWHSEHRALFVSSYMPPVDIFITVAGEPVDIVEHTIEAALRVRWPDCRVYLLNDGLVAKKDNWRDIEALARRHGITCITRTNPGGAKAGNVNNALRHTRSPFIAIFDTDHAPYPEFLETVMGYFADPGLAFVQTPQFYRNFASSRVAGGSWDQQSLFFGAICKGKNALNSVFMCGTNMVIRRTALEETGGMLERNLTEDLTTSLLMHERGWRSLYVPKVLAEGLAPEDVGAFVSQQFRWARGGLEVLFRYNPLFRRGLTWTQRIQYLASGSYFFTGIVIAIDAALPLVFFFTGATPVSVATMLLAAVFLPYIFLTVLVLGMSTSFSFTYEALAFSMSTWHLHIAAFLAMITGRRTAFSVTSKEKREGNFLPLAIPHLLYIAAATAGIPTAIMREGLTAAVVANSSWAFFNICMFLPYISASFPATSSKRLPALIGMPRTTEPTPSHSIKS